METACRPKGKPEGKGKPGRMTPFMGTHKNKLDAKGRVSIPAPFRAALKGGAGDGSDTIRVVLRPSHKQASIEGWSVAGFDGLAAGLKKLNEFSDDRDDLAFALYAEATPLDPDKEGRIGLPEHLAAHAGLTDSMVFVGLGERFEIWEPAAFERRRQEAAARTKARAITLPGSAA